MAMAILLKIYPVAAALLFVLIWPRQLGWRLAAALLVGLGLPFLLQDPAWVYRQYEGWWRVVSLDKGRQDWPLDMSYRDLRLLFRVWAAPLPSWAYTAIQLTAAGVLAGATLWAKRVLGEARDLGLIVLGLAVCWMLVLGPSTEGTTYVLLAQFLAWAVADAWGDGSGRWARAYVTAACVLMVATCPPCGFREGTIPQLRPPPRLHDARGRLPHPATRRGVRGGAAGVGCPSARTSSGSLRRDLALPPREKCDTPRTSAAASPTFPRRPRSRRTSP